MEREANPRIRSLQVVVRAYLEDGTLVEGTTTRVPVDLVDAEDARVLVLMREAAGEDPSRLSIDAELASILLRKLRELPVVGTLDGKTPKDLLELCLFRMLWNLQDGRVQPDPMAERWKQETARSNVERATSFDQVGDHEVLHDG